MSIQTTSVSPAVILNGGTYDHRNLVSSGEGGSADEGPTSDDTPSFTSSQVVETNGGSPDNDRTIDDGNIGFNYIPLNKSGQQDFEAKEAGEIHLYERNLGFMAEMVVWLEIPSGIDDYLVTFEPRGPFSIEINNFSRDEVTVRNGRAVKPVGSISQETKFFVKIEPASADRHNRCTLEVSDQLNGTGLADLGIVTG